MTQQHGFEKVNRRALLRSQTAEDIERQIEDYEWLIGELKRGRRNLMARLRRRELKLA
jgi:hypothetical protein